MSVLDIIDKTEFGPVDCVPIASIEEFRQLYKDFIVHQEIDLSNGIETLYIEFPMSGNDWNNKVHKFKARFDKYGNTVDIPPDSWTARHYDPYDELGL